MIEKKEYKFKGQRGKLISADISFRKLPNPQPIVLFAHGFKGFKDWGAWPLAAEIFALKGLPFFKFNFSHNGVKPSQPTEFTDLEAFADNNLSTELAEISSVMDFIESKSEALGFEWSGEFYLIGHSRGGGISLLAAAKDDRISKVVTWAGVGNFEHFIKMADPKDWQKEGRIYVENSRTGQKMPVDFQLYLDYYEHEADLSILDNLENIEIPLLIIHGDADETVDVSQSKSVYEQVPHAILNIIEGGDHTFKVGHPLTERKIDQQFARVLDETIEFLTM